MDFTFAFNTTIIRLKLTDIYLYYVAQGFLPPPVPNVHNRGVVPDRVKKSSPSNLEVDSEHDQGERLMREQLGMGDNLESGIEIKSVSGISGESNLRGGANMEYESESLT